MYPIAFGCRPFIKFSLCVGVTTLGDIVRIVGAVWARHATFLLQRETRVEPKESLRFLHSRQVVPG